LIERRDSRSFIIAMKIHQTIALLAGALLAIPPLTAQEESDHTLKDFTLGKVVAGDKEVAEDTKGKVVVLEFWGTR